MARQIVGPVAGETALAFVSKGAAEKAQEPAAT
jgi:hypothetical protein